MKLTLTLQHDLTKPFNRLVCNNSSKSAEQFPEANAWQYTDIVKVHANGTIMNFFLFEMKNKSARRSEYSDTSANE